MIFREEHVAISLDFNCPIKLIGDRIHWDRTLDFAFFVRRVNRTRNFYVRLRESIVKVGRRDAWTAKKAALSTVAIY